MSQTYDIACRQCKKALWIGQTSGGEPHGHIYSGVPNTMALLNTFLWAHLGHPLVFCKDSELDDYDEISTYDKEPQAAKYPYPPTGGNVVGSTARPRIDIMEVE